MKKILALAAAAALATGVSAYAANPFSDVSTDDWAYQAVSALSDQGVVEGYPDGTFKGERNMTRYELAQIIARLMAREDQLNAEQQATVSRLASEYADELANLGVRVSNLEKKVGNIAWSGDARMRYQDKSEAADSWNGRFRINAKGQVSDSTTVNARLVYNMNFQNSTGDSGVYMDVLNATHKFGDAATVIIGRYANNFGNQGGWLYGTSDNFDGAQLGLNLSKDASVLVGYGQFNNGEVIKDKDFFYAKGDAALGPVDLYVDYAKSTSNKLDAEIIGGGLGFNLSDFRVYGEYWNNTEVKDDDSAWNAGIGYGNKDLKKPGTFGIDVVYNDIDKGMYVGKLGTGLQTNVLEALSGAAAKNLTYWNVLADVVLQKNLYLHGEYAFEGELDNKDVEDSWTLSLNYNF